MNGDDHRKSFENIRNMGLTISVDEKIRKVGDISLLNMPYYVDDIICRLDNILNKQL